MKKKMAKLFLIVITQCISLTLVAHPTMIPRRVTIDNRHYTISNSDPRFNIEGVWIRDNEGLILKRNYELGGYKRVEPIEFSSMIPNDAVACVLDITRIREFTGKPDGRSNCTHITTRSFQKVNKGLRKQKLKE